MTLIEIAQIYTDLVKLEREIPEHEDCAKDQANALRTKYHELLIAKMRQEGIEFSDRFDAMNKAFQMVREQARSAREAARHRGQGYKHLIPKEHLRFIFSNFLSIKIAGRFACDIDSCPRARIAKSTFSGKARYPLPKVLASTA